MEVTRQEFNKCLNKFKKGRNVEFNSDGNLRILRNDFNQFCLLRKRDDKYFVYDEAKNYVSNVLRKESAKFIEIIYGYEKWELNKPFNGLETVYFKDNELYVHIDKFGFQRIETDNGTISKEDMPHSFLI